jgi:hypothetical protein
METRAGTCHCGAVRFEVDLEDGLSNLRRCNPHEYGFNVACLDGVDPFALGPIGLGDGAAQSLAPR